MPSLPSPARPAPPSASRSSTNGDDARSQQSRGEQSDASSASDARKSRGDQSEGSNPSERQSTAGQGEAGQDARQTAQANETADGAAAQDGAEQAGGRPGEDDWETSTELPGVAGDASRQGDESDRSAGDESEASAGDEDGTDGDEVASDGVLGTDRQSPDGEDEGGAGAELERALDDLDGDILNKRIAAQDHAKDPREQASGGGQADADNAGQPGTNDDSGGAAPGRRTIASTMPSAPPLPGPETPDMPDARDEDVVARQLREAAMAEKNPQLRAALWEEYERYVSGLRGRRAKRASNYALQYAPQYAPQVARPAGQRNVSRGQ